ncbi:hypothetical protein [Microbacterium aerolatum]|uniref:Uncharacterized protein n=1 Tax=Microbacterium aerolatum TaxID=153731 RepID=A0A511ACS0_9MICO|nr:hypothetical protein [Microbacterium aerolatum]GEK85173.1 hypothetical protein MAE01_03490 [Microbacterium aerolatum]GGB28942.1 hypothetical protein GCM10007198_19320 [Microbacterium aerolatum]
MSTDNRRFIFRPLAVFGTVVSAALTILLGFLQVGSWVNENAVWVLWVSIAALIICILLLTAHLAAVKEQAGAAARAAASESAKAVTATNEAAAAREAASIAERTAVDERETALRAVEETSALREKLKATEALAQTSTALGKLDGKLADQLFEYASNEETLTMLGMFFPYEIPRGAVGRIEELSKLPMTRVAHNDELSAHFRALTEGAQAWLDKFLPLVSTRGDHFTTRLDHDVSQEAYKQHSAKTDELGDAGFRLHERMLAYQRYYASV